MRVRAAQNILEVFRRALISDRVSSDRGHHHKPFLVLFHLVVLVTLLALRLPLEVAQPLSQIPRDFCSLHLRWFPYKN